MRPIAAASLLLVLVAGGSSPLLAQTLGNANIHGKVTDETGGALPGVSITASSAALIERQLVVVSEPDGSYRFSELPIGDYQVAFELSGFQRHIREDLHLTAGFSAEINVSLKVGAVAETITVSGQNPVVDTTAAAPSVNPVVAVPHRGPARHETHSGHSGHDPGNVDAVCRRPWWRHERRRRLHKLRHHRAVDDVD